jgi:hypothetical protein
MATIGQQLLTPEADWARYEDNNPNISYYGTWTKDVVLSEPFSGGKASYSTVLNATVALNFVGTKLRVIGRSITHSYSSSISVYIDGVNVGTFSQIGPFVEGGVLNFEILNLEFKEHRLVIQNNQDGVYFLFDALDIDPTGTISSYNPWPTGTKSTIESMAIGDIIPCKYTAKSGVAGTFSELGTCKAPDIPVTGSATPDGLFYFRKVDKGLLIADRVVQTGISWDALNAAKYIQGTYVNTVPVMSSNQSAHGVASASSSSYQPSMAFDRITDNIQNHWETTGATTGWLQFKFPFSQGIRGYTIYPQVSRTERSPKTWNLLGSNDEVTWDILDSRANISMTNSGVQFFMLNNTKKYTCYRLDVLENQGSSPLAIGEFELLSSYRIRSLAGGNAYLGTDGKASLTDKDLGGWPTNNEWDKYIVNSDLGGKVTPGDDAIWHWKDSVSSWNIDTPIIGIGVSSKRVYRGDNVAADFNIKSFNYYDSNLWGPYLGFRPVLEYPEDARCTNIWY